MQLGILRRKIKYDSYAKISISKNLKNHFVLVFTLGRSLHRPAGVYPKTLLFQQATFRLKSHLRQAPHQPVSMTTPVQKKILKNLSFLVFTLGRAPPTPTPTHPPPHTHTPTHTHPHHRWIFRNISLNFCLSESDFFGYIVQFGDIEAEKKILRQSCSKIALKTLGIMPKSVFTGHVWWPDENPVISGEYSHT